MSALHTPGPWDESNGKIFGSTATAIATAHKHQSPTVTLANAHLIAAAPALLDELKNLRRAYVNLLESGRDRIVFLGGQCDSILTMVGNDPHLKSSEAVIAKATGQ